MMESLIKTAFGEVALADKMLPDKGRISNKGGVMAREVKLTKLFSPINIGKMQLKNRIIMAPMILNYNTPQGTISERQKNYYLRRARGGVALVTAQSATVVPHSNLLPGHVTIMSDEYIPQWRDLATAIHDAGSKLSIQLTHVGREGMAAATGQVPVSPGTIPCPFTNEQPRQLSKAEIEDLIIKFGQGAKRVKQAGADCVEILGAQGELLHNFMSPLANNRADDYGGDLDGRAKFPVEVTKRVREEVGPDFPIIFRMVASDLVDGGLTVEDMKRVALKLVAAGADALHVTGGPGFDVVYLPHPSFYFSSGTIVDQVAEIKSVVSVPVIVVQRIIDPVQAEEILQAGKADIVALARALLTDPDWPMKAAEGQLEDIRHCIACTQGCVDTVLALGQGTCLHNPEAGMEKEYEIHPAPEPKKVLVAGGGPGGMEAARVAAVRGHDVTLCEKGGELGGQWILASKAPKKDGFSEVTRWTSRELEKLNVKIELNKTVTPEVVEQLKPDIVIVATGAVAAVPKILGVDRKEVVTAWDVLAAKVGVGDKVAILGGNMLGCEIADYLSERGKEVTVVEMSQELAMDLGVCRRPLLLERLTKGGVEMLTSSTVKAITDDGLIVEKNGEEKNIGIFDNVVLASGATSVNELAEQLEGKVPKVYVIGDAAEPRKGIDAIAEAARISREI